MGPLAVFVNSLTCVGFAAWHEDAFPGGPASDHVGCGGEWCSGWWWFGELEFVAELGADGFDEPCVEGDPPGFAVVDDLIF